MKKCHLTRLMHLNLQNKVIPNRVYRNRFADDLIPSSLHLRTYCGENPRQRDDNYFRFKR